MVPPGFFSKSCDPRKGNTALSTVSCWLSTSGYTTSSASWRAMSSLSTQTTSRLHSICRCRKHPTPGLAAHDNSPSFLNSRQTSSMSKGRRTQSQTPYQEPPLPRYTLGSTIKPWPWRTRMMPRYKPITIHRPI